MQSNESHDIMQKGVYIIAFCSFHPQLSCEVICV